ncbi:terminase small subunit [Salicibibacter kimchii]|nr:terminase small subunit [Salicibibacter kimchii]
MEGAFLLGAGDYVKLTPKQKRFADEYIISGNITKAAIKAGYSEKTARVTGQENLRKPAILEYIDKELEQHEIDVKLHQKQVLDYALRVLAEEETEEHAFVVKNEIGAEEVETKRLKPKIKDKTEAGKLLTTIMATVEKNRLQNMKLEKEVEKLQKEIEEGNTSEQSEVAAALRGLTDGIRANSEAE